MGELCRAHYARKRRGTDYLAPLREDMTDVDRFWANVDTRAAGGCWNWVGGKTSGGYGVMTAKGRRTYAHRFSYALQRGAIPASMYIDHVCHNTSCVNPRHLRLATPAQNQQNRGRNTQLGKSGVRGVQYVKRTGRWRAVATVNGRQVNMGSYPTVEEAAAVISTWRRENMPYSEMDKRKEIA